MKDHMLDALLTKDYGIAPERIRTFQLPAKTLSFHQLRDILIRLGQIQYEDTEAKVYIATIDSGFLKKNHALAALHLSDQILYISIYAEEGLIPQHTIEGAINEIQRSIE